LNSFTTNMGYLWNYYESFIAHCEELCFELELKALAPWGCLPFCHIYMLPTSWKTFPPKDSYSLAEEEANVFNFELDKLNLHMKHQVLKVLLSFLSFFILLIKKVYIYILTLMLGPKCKNMWLEYLFKSWNYCHLSCWIWWIILCFCCWRLTSCWCPKGFKTLMNLHNLWTLKIYFNNLM
jgi:hypothetical protein